ncbi:MAG: hypothetical protein ACE5G8_15250, partial [Anaerolineae bacterium]
MNIGRKLTTLIKATLRGSLSGGRKQRPSHSGDPQAQLEALRQNLAQVEARERQVADLLKAAQAKAQDAAAGGNRREAAAQQHLAAELETHLQHQSTQAVTLTEKLQALETTLAAQADEGRRQTGDIQPAAQSAAVGGNAPAQADPAPFPPDRFPALPR